MHPEETAAAAPAPESGHAPPAPATTSEAPPAVAAGLDDAAPAPAPGPEPSLSPAECGARLAELFPALFVAPGAPGPFKPIKLRIHADILARAPGVFSKRVLGIFFSRYTTSNPYLKALTAPGAQRFDLDGAPVGEIAEEHRAAAVEELARRHAIAAERRAAQRPLPRPAPAAPEALGEPQRPPRDHARPEGRPRRDDRPRPPRQDRPPRAQPPAAHPAQRPAASPRPETTAVAAVPADPAQRERLLLLRAYESSPLSKANFCALKRISEDDLDRLLAEAQAGRR
jgi:ProP effector